MGRRPTETEGNSWDGCRLSEGLNTRLIGKSSEDHSPMPSSCAMYPHRTASPNQPCPPERVSPGFCGVKHVQVPPEQAHRYLTQVSLSYCPTPCLMPLHVPILLPLSTGGQSPHCLPISTRKSPWSRHWSPLFGATRVRLGVGKLPPASCWGSPVTLSLRTRNRASSSRWDRKSVGRCGLPASSPRINVGEAIEAKGSKGVGN